MSRPPYWCLCCRCSSVGDVAGWRDAAALLVLRRTADAVAAGEHVLNADDECWEIMRRSVPCAAALML